MPRKKPPARRRYDTDLTDGQWDLIAPLIPEAQVGVAVDRDPRQPVGAHRRSKGGAKGYDAGKRITGRKRHILTDTEERLLAVRVHAADIQDRDGGKLPLMASRRRYPFVARVFADGGYAGRLVEWAADKTHVTLDIIRRGAGAKGFEVLPRRWVVERTFAWIFKNRRLVRDYEQITDVAETLITIAASATLLRRWP